MKAYACRQTSGHQRNAARDATEVSEGRVSSTSGKQYFLPDHDLQEVSAVWRATADEESYEEGSPALPSTTEGDELPNTENKGIREISIQEEIKNAARDGYIEQYRELSSWIGEFLTYKEIVRELGPELTYRKDAQTQVELEDWKIEPEGSENNEAQGRLELEG